MTYIILYLVIGFICWNIFIACDQLFNWGIDSSEGCLYEVAVFITLLWPIALLIAMLILTLSMCKKIYDLSDFKVRHFIETLREYIRN